MNLIGWDVSSIMLVSNGIISPTASVRRCPQGAAKFVRIFGYHLRFLEYGYHNILVIWSKQNEKY